MNKTTALAGTLALASLMSASALANTSTTSAKEAAPSIVDKLIFSYWGAFNGPSLAHPSAFTTTGGNQGIVAQSDGGDVMQLDSTLTFGYRINPNLNVAFNYRFILRPIIDGASTPFYFRNRDPWVNFVAPKLLSFGGANLWADIRFFFPATTSANIMGAIRLTQITSYDVPKTRLSLGLFTFERANLLTEKGAQGNFENYSFVVSPFGSYQLTPTLSATLWTDVVQATYSTVGVDGGVPEGWDNSSMDICVGVAWDITPKLNVNPMLIYYPASNSLENVILGAQISARFL